MTTPRSPIGERPDGADEIIHIVGELYHLIETLDFRLCTSGRGDDDARRLIEAHEIAEVERLVAELRRHVIRR